MINCSWYSLVSDHRGDGIDDLWLLIFLPVKTNREHAMVLQCRHKKLLIGWFTEFLQRRAWDLSNLLNKLIMKKYGVGTLQRDLSQAASVTLLHHLGGNNFQLFLHNLYRENHPVEKTFQLFCRIFINLWTFLYLKKGVLCGATWRNKAKMAFKNRQSGLWVVGKGTETLYVS